MEKRTPQNIDEIIEKFLDQIPKRSQTKAAKTLGIRKQDFNNYYNHRYNPPEELLIEMVRFLDERGVYLCHEKRPKAKPLAIELSILERVQQGKTLENGLKARRGRPVSQKKHKKSIKRQNFVTFKGRTSERAAKACDVGNRETYRQANQLALSGSAALKRAVHMDRLRVDEAYQLLKWSSDEQAVFLKKTDQEIKDYFKALKKEERRRKLEEKICKLIDASLVLMEAEKKLQSPLRAQLMEEMSAIMSQS